MMRIFLCRECRRWQFISDRLQGQCNQCGGMLLGTDIPFEDFVDLTEAQRYELIDYAGICLGQSVTGQQQTEEKRGKRGSNSKQSQSYNELLRKKVSSFLNREIHSNRELPEDTGYDY